MYMGRDADTDVDVDVNLDIMSMHAYIHISIYMHVYVVYHGSITARISAFNIQNFDGCHYYTGLGESCKFGS